MAVKTYRDWAKATKGITSPEMYVTSLTRSPTSLPPFPLLTRPRVVPASAHAAFFKAAQYFGIKIRVIPVNEKTRRADVDWISRAMCVMLDISPRSINIPTDSSFQQCQHHYDCRFCAQFPRWHHCELYTSDSCGFATDSRCSGPDQAPWRNC